MCAGDTPEDCGAKHVVFGVHFVPLSGAFGGPWRFRCVCVRVCVYIEVWAPCSRGSYARRATRCEASSYAVAGHHPRHPTTSPKSPATTSDTLSSSTSALHITSRRYELRELALLLGMCGQLVHQTFINCEGHFFFFHFRSFLASCGKTKEYASGDVVPCMN